MSTLLARRLARKPLHDTSLLRQLSADEKHALDLLEGRERGWRKSRWVLLALGIVSLGLSWFSMQRQRELLDTLMHPGGERFHPVFLPLAAAPVTAAALYLPALRLAGPHGSVLPEAL